MPRPRLFIHRPRFLSNLNSRPFGVPNFSIFSILPIVSSASKTAPREDASCVSGRIIFRPRTSAIICVQTGEAQRSARGDDVANLGHIVQLVEYLARIYKPPIRAQPGQYRSCRWRSAGPESPLLRVRDSLCCARRRETAEMLARAHRVRVLLSQPRFYCRHRVSRRFSLSH